MAAKLKYQLIEEVKTLERSLDLMRDESNILWEIVGCLVDREHPTYLKLRTKIGILNDIFSKEHIAITSDNRIEIENKMRELGFTETAPDTMHYTLTGCDRKFRVRSRPPGVVVEKGEDLKTFDRWANSIESVYYLTTESGNDLISWAASKEDE